MTKYEIDYIVWHEGNWELMLTKYDGEVPF